MLKLGPRISQCSPKLCVVQGQLEEPGIGEETPHSGWAEGS